MPTLSLVLFAACSQDMPAGGTHAIDGASRTPDDLPEAFTWTTGCTSADQVVVDEFNDLWLYQRTVFNGDGREVTIESVWPDDFNNGTLDWFEFDNAGRHTYRFKNHHDRTFEADDREAYFYNDAGQILREERCAEPPFWDPEIVEAYFYDDHGRLIEQHLELAHGDRVIDGSVDVRTVTTHSDASTRAETDAYDIDPASGELRWGYADGLVDEVVVTHHDDQSRPIQLLRFWEAPFVEPSDIASTIYNDAGQHLETVTRDADGAVLSIRRSAYNTDGLLLREWTESTDGVLTRETVYTYDTEGRLAQQTHLAPVNDTSGLLPYNTQVTTYCADLL